MSCLCLSYLSCLSLSYLLLFYLCLSHLSLLRVSHLSHLCPSHLSLLRLFHLHLSHLCTSAVPPVLPPSVPPLPADQSYTREAGVSPNGNILATLWGGQFNANDYPVSLHVWNGQKFVLGKFLHYTKDNTPVAVPAFSPDSAVMGLSRVIVVENGNQVQVTANIELHSVQADYRTGKIVTELLCSVDLPKPVNLLTKTGYATGES